MRMREGHFTLRTSWNSLKGARSAALKAQLHADLDASWLARAGDLAEVGGSETGRNSQEICVIQEVETLTAELEPKALGDIEILKQGNIPALVARTIHRGSCGVPRPDLAGGH